MKMFWIFIQEYGFRAGCDSGIMKQFYKLIDILMGWCKKDVAPVR